VQRSVDLAGNRAEVLRVTESHVIGLLGVDQFVERVLPNRLKQVIPGPCFGIEDHDRGFDQSPEQVENLEQLRVLDAGHTILVGVIADPTIGIDTPADYRAFVQRQGVV